MDELGLGVIETRSVTRQCSMCRIEKALVTEFYPEKRRPQGYAYHCKKCHALKVRLYRARPEIQEKLKIKTREYQQRPDVREKHAFVRLKARCGITGKIGSG
jgi:hypothetical protein